MKRASKFVLAASLLALPLSAVEIGGNGGLASTNNPDVPPISEEYRRTLYQFHVLVNNGGATWAQMDPAHKGFHMVVRNPGGVLGGEIERFQSVLEFNIVGQGPLEGWSRTLVVPARCETHTAPRNREADVQSFETDMQRIEGGIRNDPDFEYFEVVAGTANGFPSPGHTTFFRQSDGTWLLDSKFNVHYSIRFKGAKGGKFEGIEDTFEGTITMAAMEPQPKN